MADVAVFQGSLVNLKNSPTHKSVILQVEIPEEYGEAIVRAFGWPTRVKPLPVAVARLEEGMPKKAEPQPDATPKRFDDLSPAEQAGILCKEEGFAEFMRYAYYLTPPDMSAAEAVRHTCGVKSRKDINPHEPSGRTWADIVRGYRRWQDERDRLDVDF
jgi:hypothetical protein